MAIRDVHHVALSTPDLDAAIAFYRDVIGGEVLDEFGWPVGTRVADAITGLSGSACRAALLRVGSTHIELFEFSEPTPSPVTTDRPVSELGWTHVCFDVTDIDAEYARLSSAGVRFHTEPVTVMHGAVRATYGRDPFGNVIELQEVLSDEHSWSLTSARSTT